MLHGWSFHACGKHSAGLLSEGWNAVVIAVSAVVAAYVRDPTTTHPKPNAELWTETYLNINHNEKCCCAECSQKRAMQGGREPGAGA